MTGLPGSPQGTVGYTDVMNATTPAEVADAIRDARSSGTALRLAGAGSWMDAGRAVQASRLLSLHGLRGIVEYVPGDLTLTALAGTTLAELDAATAAEGQWAPLDPYGSPEGTLGATIATASAGPLAGSSGRPRDAVLGIEAVLGQGDAVRVGGRVVKNVAGFDLVRLLTGSWGTLGAITHVTVRLRARAELDVSTGFAAPDDAAALGEMLARLAALPVAPAACELLDPVLAAHLGLPMRTTLLMRLMGSRTSVDAAREAARALGRPWETDTEVWNALRQGDPPGAATIRWSAGPAQLPRLWEAARIVAQPAGARTHASVLRGVVRQMAPAHNAVDLGAAWGALPSSLLPLEVSVVAERLPGSLWPVIAPSEVDDRLSRAVRQAFDPDYLLNPGIMGEDLPELSIPLARTFDA